MADYGIVSGYDFSAALNEQKVSSDNPIDSDHFGNSVAISGNYAIIGAPDENSSNSGAVYFFELSGGIWSLKSTHKASNAAGDDQFGISVAISGNYAIVGALGEDGTSNNIANCGAAYIFELSGGIWSEKTILRAGNLGPNDYFGGSVAISGNTAIVGATGEDGTSTAVAADTRNYGAVYIFERNTTSNVWAAGTVPAILRADNFGIDDRFGISVAISGNYMVVGAPQEDGTSNNIADCGAAYIFERPTSTGTWVQKPVLRANNLDADDQFGASVAISGDYAIVGAPNEDGTATTENFGAAYIFERDASGNWIQKPKLQASNQGLNYTFGSSVKILGNSAVVSSGSSISDNSGGPVYIFERNSSGIWNQINMIRPSNVGNVGYFALSVAVDAGSILVGVPYAVSGTNSQNCGAAYFYSAGPATNPTPLTFSGNTLTVSNDITATDKDKVSFSLDSGAKLYPFRVTNFSGTGTVTYSLNISGGSTVATGTFTTIGANLLNGTPLVASGATTYILTLTSNAAITYTIVGSLLTAPTNILLSTNSVNELKPIGTTIGTLTCDNLDNDLITYSVSDTANFSITGSTLKTNAIFDFESMPSYTITITASIGGLTSSNSRIITVTNISNEAAELRSQNLQGLALQTAVVSQSNPPITAADLKAAGYSAAELKAAGYTATQLRSAGYTATQLRSAGYTATNMIAASYTATELKALGYTATEMKTAGYNATQLIELGYTLTDLKAASFTATELKALGYTATELKAAIYTANELKAAGYNESQLISGGFLPSRNIDASANYFLNSYVNDFVDISGDLLIRNTGAIVVGGDVSLNAVSVTGSTLFTNDILLKSRLFLGGDISANGKLYVGGDLSVNGRFNGLLNGGFAAGTIPSTAVIGYTTGSVAGDIAITGNVLIVGDASFNGTTVGLGTNTVLKVGGRLDLSDGSYMTTYDDNILSGSYANGNVVLKDSRFSSVNVIGAATVVGSITSTSDYRIKTNVMELGETDNVDQLMPIQYNNILTNSHEYGVLAHELQAVYPDLVKGEKDGHEYQRVYYNGLIGVLVKEVQALKRRLAALE